jgi:hypothetical protein
MLTSAGTSLGFSLSKYYSDPSYYGILGVTSGPGGAIYGAGFSSGEVLKLAPSDGQTYASVLAKAATGVGTPSGMVYAGGHLYLGVVGGGYYEVNPTTLALTPLSLDQAVYHYYGMWANPTNGHFLAGDAYGLLDINPATGHVTVVGGAGPDGVTISPDGATGYGEYSGHILGYSLTSLNPSTPIFDSGYLPGGPDGTGIITGGALNGDIIVNMNDGSIVLLDPLTKVTTLIATGGSRGDLVGPDMTSGTLLLDFSYDGLWRLAYAGGSIGGGGGNGNPGVPEPGTIFLLTAGLLSLGAWRLRKAS